MVGWDGAARARCWPLTWEKRWKFRSIDSSSSSPAASAAIAALRLASPRRPRSAPGGGGTRRRAMNARDGVSDRTKYSKRSLWGAILEYKTIQGELFQIYTARFFYFFLS